MKFENILLTSGIALLAVALGIMVFDPVTRTEDPDPRFNVEVSSFANGDAEFVYRPMQNDSLDVYMTYNITVDNQSIESVENRKVENISYEQPFRVTVQADPDQEVTVFMKIKDLAGELLHDSRHTISGVQQE